MSFDINLRVIFSVDPSVGGVLASALKPLIDSVRDQIVSKLSDAIADASKSADDAIARVQSDVSALKSQIETLQQQVDSGGATQADLDNLASLRQRLEALDPTSPATLPPTS